MKKIVVLTGAGISAESGLKTFRGSGGLWEGMEVTQVATPEAFAENPELVLRFYNERRVQAMAAQPNAGHLELKRLEQAYDVQIITQNVDNLHEKAGSSQIIHLHGILTKKQSSSNSNLIEDWNEDLKLGNLAPDGGQWRPHIVWFGEQVPMLERAARIASMADILLIVGTSLVVYPAAGLIHYVRSGTPIFVVDPNKPLGIEEIKGLIFIEAKASEGLPPLVDQLLHEAE